MKKMKDDLMKRIKKKLITELEAENLYFKTYNEEWWRDLNKYADFHRSLLNNGYEINGDDTESSCKIQFINSVVSRALNIKYDIQLLNIIREDISEIYREVGGQDGMYEHLSFCRIFRGKPYNRVYSLGFHGGLVLISGENQYQILTLAEDDGYFYPVCSNVFESICGNKTDFVYLLSSLISAFNNNDV